MALHYPERVSSLVLVSTGMVPKELSLPPKPVVAGTVSSDYFFWLLTIEPGSDGLVFDMFVTNLDVYNNEAEYDFSQLEVPTMIVNAKDDPAAVYEDALTISRQIPQARFAW